MHGNLLKNYKIIRFFRSNCTFGYIKLYLKLINYFQLKGDSGGPLISKDSSKAAGDRWTQVCIF